MKPIPNACGIGLRLPHYEQVVSTFPKVAWFEIHSENFFTQNAYLHNILSIAAENYPLSFHSVSLSLGSVDPVNLLHLKRLKELIDLYRPGLISEHLAWTSVEGEYLHDLLPLPYTPESLEVCCKKTSYIQDYLGRQILIENPSLYVSFPDSSIKEVDFLNTLCARTGCGILLDINNVYVSNYNLDFLLKEKLAKEYLNNIEARWVREIHLAGFERAEERLLDTHSGGVSSAVLDLFEYFLKKYGARPTIFEQDQNLSSVEELLKQASIIDQLINNYIAMN